MARIGKLSAMKVAALVRGARPGLTGDGGGLYLRISRAGGTASWVFRYRIRGKLRDAGLGSVETWSLAEARERARKLRQLRGDGLDPIEVRKSTRLEERLEAAKVMTFEQCAERYIAAHRAGWRNEKHRQQWGNTLATYVSPVFGALPVAAVDVGLVMRALEPIWTEKPETAGRVRGRIESVLDWAKARGYRQGENPARWRGHLENLLPKKSKISRVAHHAALPYPELPEFMAELRQQDGVSSRALEFAILTAARTGEVIGARWSEIDLEARLWTVPASRMKAGKEHRVPLSDAALAILKDMHAIRQAAAFVFPGVRAGRTLSNMSLIAVLRRMGRAMTAHGFRSSFRDWAAERTGFPAEVAEMALAHVVGDKVEAAYRRGAMLDKRRQLAEAWARYCNSPPSTGTVLPLRRAGE
jgi:integrase